MKAFNHCKSSVRHFGGKEMDYHNIHAWFDDSKTHWSDHRHRALRHHTLGVIMCEKEFGIYILNSENKKVPVKSIAEQHIREDLGFIPSLQDWFKEITPRSWMASNRKVVKKKINLM
jgi:hypothetical protein